MFERKYCKHMSRLKIGCSAALFLVLLIVGFEVFRSSAGANAPAKPTPPPAVIAKHNVFQSSNTYVAGNPAIHPHLAQNGSGPAFTQADVAAYFAKYGFYAGPVVAGAQLKILTVQFVTAAQASQLMVGESVGRPDNALVCYVKVEGPF